MPSSSAAACRLRPALRPRVPAWLLLAALGSPLAAEPEPPPPTERITITGQRQPAAAPDTGPALTLQGAGLRNRQAATLGATLEQELGVGNASFGAGVGLPVIRGQGGSRTRVMQGGLGTHDASSVSADHGVMVEPALAERITVHRGPAAVRFGGNAIGGAVEVDEQRIPMRRPARLRGRTQVRGGTDGGLAMLRLDGPAAETLAWHVDVHGRRSPRTRIAGWALDEEAIRQQFQLVNGRNSRGRIDNTDARSWSSTTGCRRARTRTPPGRPAPRRRPTGCASRPGSSGSICRASSTSTRRTFRSCGCAPRRSTMHTTRWTRAAWAAASTTR